MINRYSSLVKNSVVNLVFKKNLFKTVFLLTSILFTNLSFAQGPVQAGTVTSTNGLFTVKYNFQDNICPTDNSGTITINTINSNNFAGYSYRWKDNTSLNNHKRIGLPGDSNPYEVEITDLNNSANKDIIKILISSPKGISFEEGSLIRPQCNGAPNGKTNLKVSGGTMFPTGEPYKYIWTKKGTTSPIISTLDNFTGAAGSYSLKAIDANGCSNTYPYDIEDAPVFKVNPTAKVDNVEFRQFNGKITLDIRGGTPFPGANPYTYEWYLNGNLIPSFSGPEQSGLGSGVYKIIVKDANGCTAPVPNVTIEPLFLLKSEPEWKNNTCKATPNGSIDLKISGGKSPYTIKWDDLPNPTTSTIRNGLDKGTYTGEFTDAFGAKRPIGPILIDGPELLVLDPLSHTDNICFSPPYTATITLKVSGGIAPYRYILNGGTPVTFTGDSFVIPNLSSRNYTVSIIDAGNCVTTPPQIVDILPLKALAFTSVIPNKITCGLANSGRIDAVVTGGYTGNYTYEWSNAAGIIPNETSSILNGVTKGVYSLKVNDNLVLGCEIIRNNIEIVDNSSTLIVNEIIANRVNNGCYKNEFGVINKNGNVSIQVLNGSGNYEYKFKLNDVDIVIPILNISPGRVNLPNLQSGSYKLFVKDLFNGCAADMFPFSITPVDSIEFGAIVTPQTCANANNGTIDLHPTGVSAPSIQWSDDLNNFSTFRRDLAPGNYIVTIYDLTCSLRDTFTILPAIPLTQLDTLIQKSDVCKGGLPNGSIKLTVQGGKPPYSFKWSIADPSTGNIITDLPPAPRNSLLPVNEDEIKDLPQGFYVVTVTDANGCITFLPSLDPLNALPKTYQVLPVSCTLANDKLKVDPLMSPNDDGQGNNFFNINNIENFPDNEVIIYNRWGMEVFTIKRYNNQDRVFRGVANSALTNKNQVLVDGVYYYTIRTVQDKISRINKGYVIMKR